MKNKNFGRKRQAIYILSNRKSTRIIKTLMDFFFFIKVKIKMVCFSVPSIAVQRGSLGYPNMDSITITLQILYHKSCDMTIFDVFYYMMCKFFYLPSISSSIALKFPFLCNINWYILSTSPASSSIPATKEACRKQKRKIQFLT